MKVKKSIVDLRRQTILEILNKQQEVKVKPLADQFHVSELTIRRDLDVLGEKGLIHRFHGGARQLDFDVLAEDREKNRTKENIAKKGAEFIEEGDTIFVNSSSTALLCLKYITDRRVTIITNNGKALQIDLDGKINLVLTGGTIEFPKVALTGAFALNNLSTVSADKAILGFSGIDIEAGLTTSNLEEVDINSYMLGNSGNQNVVVVESSKLNHIDNFKSGDLRCVTTIITDYDAPRKTVEKLEKLGIQVLLVE